MKIEEIEIEFKPHQMADVPEIKGYPDLMKKWKDSKQGTFKCGSLEFSILLGEMFYSNGVDTYEIWVLDDAHREVLGDEYDQPAGYLTMKEVKAYIVMACVEWRMK